MRSAQDCPSGNQITCPAQPWPQESDVISYQLGHVQTHGPLPSLESSLLPWDPQGIAGKFTWG